MKFGALLVTALSRPHRLGAGDVRAIEDGLLSRDRRHRAAALHALAGLVYARPALVRDATVRALGRALSRSTPTDAAAVGEAFVHLLATPRAPSAARRLVRALAGRRLGTPVRRALLSALGQLAGRRPGLIGLDAALRIASLARGERGAQDVVERLCLAMPRRLTRARLERLARLVPRRRRRYTLAAIAASPDVPAGVRAAAGRRRVASSLRARAMRSLRTGPFELLVVHNIDDGQGDEIVRIGPLLQALLDGNRELTATVLTRRTYLYDAPRVAPGSILDDGVVERTLRRGYDGALVLHEAGVPEVNYRPALCDRLAAWLAARRPRLTIRSDKGRNHFAFKDVTLGGRRLARRLGVDRPDIGNLYDPVERLVIELGLPLRLGEGRPATPSCFAGSPSSQAAAVWRRLTGRARRTVLVNPFGGREPLKGFTREHLGTLAAGLGGLVDEGFHVVLLPNGQPWGGAGTIAAVLARLDAGRRARVAVAPDPTAPGDALEIALGERPELAPADRTMRLFKYFAAYADLVVTVEGWLAHLAYALGRPFRLLLAPHSHGADWQPRWRGPRQRLAASLSPRVPPPPGPGLGRAGAPPPWPPHKAMLIAALGGLGRVEGLDGLRLFDRALASPDWEIRRAAVGALGARRAPRPHAARLIALLDDPAAPVRAAAARALLAGRRAGAPGDTRAQRARLIAHREIARQNWAAVAALGAAALPALAVAARDVDDVIRREARWTAQRLLTRWVPAAAGRGR